MTSDPGTVRVTFRTSAPLPQAAGQALWALALHFGQVGPSTYTLQTRVPAGMGLFDAVAALLDRVTLAVADTGGPAADGPIVVEQITAQVQP